VQDKATFWKKPRHGSASSTPKRGREKEKTRVLGHLNGVEYNGSLKESIPANPPCGSAIRRCDTRRDPHIILEFVGQGP